MLLILSIITGNFLIGVLSNRNCLIVSSTLMGLLLIFRVEDSPKHLILKSFFFIPILQNPAYFIVAKDFATSECSTSFTNIIGLLLSSIIMYFYNHKILQPHFAEPVSLLQLAILTLSPIHGKLLYYFGSF